MTVVYADLTFLLNAGLNYLVFCCTMRLSGLPVRRLRVLAQKDDSAVLLLPYLRKTQPPRLERDLLHLAVCTGSWPQTAEAMGNRANWYWKPRCALSGEQFRQTFTGKEPLWVLEPEA